MFNKSSRASGSRIEGLAEIGVVTISAVVGTLLAVGGMIWFLIDAASKGSSAALIVLSIIATLVVMGLSFLLFWGTLKVNQSQDERAMLMQLKMFNANAQENITIMAELQKHQLLMARTREADNKADLVAGRVEKQNAPQPTAGLVTIPGAFDGLE